MSNIDKHLSSMLGQLSKDLALVYCIPKNDFQRNEAYLFKDSKKSRVYITDTYQKGSQKIITTYHDFE